MGKAKGFPNKNPNQMIFVKEKRKKRKGEDSFPKHSQVWGRAIKEIVPRKVQLFAWLLALGKPNTGDIIQRQNPNERLSPSSCIMCKRNGKSEDHLFLHCQTAVQLWHRLSQAAKISWVMPASSISMLSEFIHAFGRGENAILLWQCPVMATF